MDSVILLSAEAIGRNFIPKEWLPPGGDEYSRRNEQAPWPGNRWRHLRADEVERLIQNDNSSDDWDQVCVADPFDPQKIRNTA